MKYSTVFIAFFLLIGAITAVPTQHYSERTTTCAKKCLNHESNLFKEIGETTTLNYETTSEIELENGQKTQVHVQAKVDIATLSNCEHQMQLRKVQINGPQEAETMKKQLERHSTKFAQDNSRIEHICFDDHEETWVLNFKKSILSTIQVSARQSEEQVEKDILGYCKTKYEQISSNTLQKTKFLSTCDKRKSVNSILTGDFDPSKKSTCKIQLDNEKQVPKSVVCEETNVMYPFAQSKASGHISTRTKLSLDKIEKSLPQNSNRQLIRDNLQFTKKHYQQRSNQNSEENFKAAEQLISEIRSNVEHNVQKETPELIKKLSQHLAALNVHELERLAQQVSNKNDKVQDIFFDTVAQTGTQETAHIILQAILDNKHYQGEKSKMRSAFWLSMLSNVEKVNDEILNIAKEHLKKHNLPRQALFALTNMIKEVKETEQDIEKDHRYQQVVEALIERLNRQSEKHEKIATLKALRNTGIHEQAFEQILKVAQKHSEHVETRIAAVQALEEQVDEERYHQKVMQIFEDKSNEAELRIAAFQVLVNNQEKVHELYNVLKTETNKQVASYVVSFFENAKKSQLPEFETLRRIASTFDLKSVRAHTGEGLRKSKHIQFTQHIESLNLGAQVEADLVFDEQKQLRNVRARFDLNKENLQLKSVEITLRQNGLPEVAQKMAEELTKQTNLNAIVEEIKEMTSIRSKHHLNQKINRLIQLLNLNKINLGNKRFTEQMDASLHVRVEDKTVLYINLKDIQHYTRSLEQHYNQREQIVDQIAESLIGDNAITLIFSNKQHKMPTSHGLPIHTGHSLVIVAGLKVENGAFFPSIATDLHYEMGFAAQKVRPAVHHHIGMHSAPGVKVNVERKNGVPTKLTIAMPEDHLEIISMRSMVKFQTATHETELNVEKKEYQSSTRLFNKIFGVELSLKTVHARNLIEKNAINALLNGHYEMSLQLEKTDKSIRHWELVFVTPFAQRSDEAKELHFAFRTVGSRSEREVSAKIELQNERDSKIVHVELKTPVTSPIQIEGRAQWNNERVGVKAALIVSNQRFEAEIGGERVNRNGEQQYKPLIKLTIPGQKKIHYTGEIALVNSGKKENFQIELRDSTTGKPLVKASMIKSGKMEAQGNFKLATDVHAFWFTGSSIRFVSNIDKKSNGLTTDLEVIHSGSHHAPTTYKWKLALNDLSNNQNSKYNADFELNVPNTEYENIVLSWNYANKQNQEVETELTGFWNNQNGQKTRQVHVLQQLKLNKASARISSLNENLLKIEIVPLSVNYEVQAKTNWQRSQQKYNVQLTARDVQTNKQYKGEMSYQMPESKPLKMNLEARVMIENNEFKIIHNIEEQQSQQYHGRTMIQLRKGQHVEMNYVYKMREHSLQIPRLNHELDAEIRIPSKSMVLKHKSALKMNYNQFELIHQLKNNNQLISDVKISLDKNRKSQLLIDNQIFQVKMDADQSSNQKQVNVAVEAKKHQIQHHTQLTWNGRQQMKVDSKTTQNQRQIHSLQVDYAKNQKAELTASVEKLGELTVKHQPNSQKWADVEIKSDYFSKPIRQHFTIERESSNKYTIRSKTHQNQKVVGELDLQLGSQSALKVSAFDWKITGRALGKEMINLSLENAKRNLREEVEIELRNRVAKIEIKHLDEQQRTSRLFGQASAVDESRLQLETEHSNMELSVKPTGQYQHIKLTVNDKKHNMQHKSELRRENRALVATLEHSRDNQNVINHQTRFSLKDDSFTRTETQDFEIAVTYKWRSGAELKYKNHKNGWKHHSKVEISDARKQVAQISSSTSKDGRKILDLNIDVDSLRKIDWQVAHKDDKEIKLKWNLKGEQKHADLHLRSAHHELRSKWNKESHKDQKYTLEITDKKHDSTYNLLAHYQRKTLLNIKVDSLRDAQTRSGELKLHKKGEAFFKLNGKEMKLRTELDFARRPAQATVEWENKRHSLKHLTTATFLQQENELKIKSQTHKNGQQIANVDFKINPSTKEIAASGEIDNKSLKIEGNVNRRFTVKLENMKTHEQFKHQTELDLNARTLRSETEKDNQKVHHFEAQFVNKRDVQGSAKMNEHEIEFKSNQQAGQFELNYNNKKRGIRSTGLYTINRRSIRAKINGQQRSKQVLDFEANLRWDAQQSLDAKLEAFETRSSAKIEILTAQKVRASMSFDTKDVKGQASVDTSNHDEISVKFEARDGEEKKIANLKSKLSKGYNKLALNIEFDSEIVTPYTLNSEWKKEADQWIMKTDIESRQQKVGQLDARFRVQGYSVDAKLDGHLTVNGKRSEILYKLNNWSDKIEYVLKLQNGNNYSYGYEITFHLKKGKFIIHLPDRMVEVRYDVATKTNGHVLLTTAILPNSQHEPNNIYTVTFDNLITMSDKEMILNTKTTVHHPEIHHPIELQFRGELRELHHQRPFVVFVSYDASSKQQNRISGLFEIMNESSVRVAHVNISHQNQPIFDVHYRWAITTQLVHQQLSWMVMKQNNQRQNGELLGQINLKQRQAKLELNNKHKLQMNWEKNFDRNTMIQLRAQTDNLVKKTKIMTNYKENQLEITNYENERVVSNYIVSMLRERNTLFAVEMHKKQGSNKLQKVAFIQLVKDSLNYAKVHVKVEKSLVYEAQQAVDQWKSKARSVAKRHAQEIESLIREQYDEMKLREQCDNTIRYAKRVAEDVKEIAREYVRSLQKYMPNLFEAVESVYGSISQHMRHVWNVNLEQKINDFITELMEQFQYAERKMNQFIEQVQYEKTSRNVRDLKERFNHEVVEKLANQFEENLQETIRFAEQEGERVYQVLHRNLHHVRLHKAVEQMRDVLSRAKNQLKEMRVHENLHRLVDYQNAFASKFDLNGDGEMIAKIYYPSWLLN